MRESILTFTTGNTTAENWLLLNELKSHIQPVKLSRRQKRAAERKAKI